MSARQEMRARYTGPTAAARPTAIGNAATGRTIIDAELSFIRMHHASGVDISEALIGWAKRAYLCDRIDAEVMECVVGLALSGRSAEWLHPSDTVALPP